MDMLGRVQLPDWKVWVLGVVPVVTGCAERRLQPEPEGLDIDRDHHLAIGGDRILDRGQRIAAIAQQFGFQQRLFRPERGPGKGHHAGTR